MGSILFTFMLEQQRRNRVTRVIKIKNEGVLSVKLNMTRCFESRTFIEICKALIVFNTFLQGEKVISVFVKINSYGMGFCNPLHSCNV